MAERDSTQTATLLIGDVESPSFEAVRRHISGGDARIAATAKEALTLLDAEPWSPDVIVVWQGVPDEYPRSAVEKLIGRLPLARWVVVFGPWCESIGRTEQLWPVAWSVPLRHAVTRIETEFARVRSGVAPTPATMSRDETFADYCSLADNSMTSNPSRSACLTTDDHEYGLFLREALLLLGIEVSDDLNAMLQIIHVTVPVDATVDTVRLRRDAAPESRIVVVSELTTLQFERRLLDAGADATFTQLRFINELEEWL